MEEIAFDGQRTAYAYDGDGQLAEKRAYGLPADKTATHLPALANLNDPAVWAAMTRANLDNPDFNLLGFGTDSSSPQAGNDPLRTVFERDALGRLTRIVTPDGITHFQHDDIGRLIQVRNAHSRTTFAYDALGQLLEETSIIDGQTYASRHQYDSLGNRIATTLPDARVVHTLTYGSGHVHQINLDGVVIADIERNCLHREIRRSQGALASHYGHDPQGRLILQRALPGHVDTPPAIWEALGGPRGPNNIAGNPTGFDTPGGTPLAPAIQRQYQYDRNGQLTSLIDARKGATQYRYDDIGRLTLARSRDAHELFAFDPAHNLVAPAKPSAPGTKPAGLAPRLVNNLLEAWDQARYRHDRWGNRIETMRSDGSLQRLVWNSQNQLIEAVEQRSGKLIRRSQYRYDALGRRIGKDVTDHDRQGTARTHSTRFVWDGNRLLLEQTDTRQRLYLHEPGSFVPLACIDNDLTWPDPVTATGEPADPSADNAATLDPQAFKALMHQRPGAILQALQNTRFARLQINPLAYATEGGLPLSGMPGKTAPVLSNSRIYWYHCDHLGTPQELTDAQGHLVWAASYQAWGKIRKVQRFETRTVGNTVQQVLVEKEPVAQNVRFQGQYEDAETGFYYNRFRYFDPGIGRFISQDPVGLAGGVNLYAYAKNPTGWVDPLGLAPCKPCPCPAGTMDPKDVHFMQNNARNTTGDYTVLGNAEGLSNGTLDPNILKIRVWQDASGKMWTLDHRRLAAFRLAKKCVPVDRLERDSIDPRELKRKMSTENGGTSMELKLENGRRILVE